MAEKWYLCKLVSESKIMGFFVSERMTSAPERFSTPLQEKVYAMLSRLGIGFERVDTDPGITMEDCQNINSGLGGRIVKTLFLCNRQQTIFYLYVTRDNKPFVTKDFGAALGIPRVSFASAELLQEKVGTEHGASTILSACLDSARDVNFVIDREVLESEDFCCADGTVGCFMKLKTSDLLNVYLPACGHKPIII